VSFNETEWYQVGKNYYNETMYQPSDWEESCRFVVMRIPKEKGDETCEQLSLFDSSKYKHRVFATDLLWKVHGVINKYDKRADVENLIGESQDEGILAIPSKRFLSNHAFFQIVMLSYNIWRWMKLITGYQNIRSEKANLGETEIPDQIADHTIRIARLKMLFLPAKITKTENKTKVKYSVHDERSAGLLKYLSYLDRMRRLGIKWLDNVLLGRYRVPKVT
jgi:hypothetical protein